jgi:hypothetical protein
MSEVGVVRRRRSRSETEALVAEFEASGLMREAFCELRGLAVGTLDKYRRRVQRGPQSDGGSLLPVEVVSARGHDANSAGRDGVLVVESRSGRRIEVRRGFDAVTLERMRTAKHPVDAVRRASLEVSGSVLRPTLLA